MRKRAESADRETILSGRRSFVTTVSCILACHVCSVMCVPESARNGGGFLVGVFLLDPGCIFSHYFLTIFLAIIDRIPFRLAIDPRRSNRSGCLDSLLIILSWR